MNPSFLLLECTEAGSDAGKTPYKSMGLFHGGIQVIGLHKSRETHFNIYYQHIFSNLFRNTSLYEQL